MTPKTMPIRIAFGVNSAGDCDGGIYGWKPRAASGGAAVLVVVEWAMRRMITGHAGKGVGASRHRRAGPAAASRRERPRSLTLAWDGLAGRPLGPLAHFVREEDVQVRRTSST